MPINAGLINALMPRVRSVQDYQDDYTRQDIAQQGLQRNALLMQQAQQQQQEQQQAAAQAQQSHNALMQEVRGMPPGDNPRLQALHRLTLAGAMKPTDYVNEAMPKQAAPSRQVVGGSLVEVAGDGAVKELYKAPEKKPLPPEIVQLIDFSRSLPPGDPRKGQIEQAIQKQLTHAPAPSAVSYGSPVPFLLPDGLVGYAQPGNKPGAPPQVLTAPGGKPLVKPGDDMKPPTVEEKGAAGYASRMTEATKLLDGMEKSGRPSYGTDAAGGLPFVGNKARTIAMTPAQQQYRQAQEDWVRAKLRKESGAAIGADEMDREILAYFPQPGETDKGILEQKRRARAIATEGMVKAAGRAAYKSEVPPVAAPAASGVKFLGFE